MTVMLNKWYEGDLPFILGGFLLFGGLIFVMLVIEYRIKSDIEKNKEQTKEGN